MTLVLKCGSIKEKFLPVLVGNEIGKAARFRRVPDSKESPTGLTPASRSRPRSPVSVPPPSLDNTHDKLFGKRFFQIIPLGMHHTLLLGTNFTPPLQAPRFSHTLGALDPKSHVDSQLFLRAAEDDLGVSFNTQSQTPDIPGISSLNQLSLYLGSFNTQSKIPDNPTPSLWVSIQKLSVSFNVQAQDPDDPHFVQNPQCAPCDLYFSSLPVSQVIPRLYTKCHIHPLLIPIVSQDHTYWTPSHIRKTPNQGFWHSVVHVLRLWIRFVDKT